MSIKVGIPRALFYYEYYPLWNRFFKELGVEVILSDQTNTKILNDGVSSCVDEACLPVKLFHGHVINLIGRVDFILILRFTSISKNEYVCPKFGGLPDMVKATISGLPPIINTEVNLRKSNKNALKAAIEVGMHFTGNKKKITSAYKLALGDYRIHRNLIKSRLKKKNDEDASLNILLLGHVYNIYDSFINRDIVSKLTAEGINVTTIDMVDGKDVNQKISILDKRMFWNFGRKALGGALYLSEAGGIDGIISLMSFGCGVDSFVCDLIERRIRRSSDIPLIVLTLDEHSGEAGMNTRIEAFVDMLKRRDRNGTYVSANG